MDGPAVQVAPAAKQNQLDPVRMQALVNAVAAQRNLANDQLVNAQAEIAVLQRRIELLEQSNKLLVARLQEFADKKAEPGQGAA